MIAMIAHSRQLAKLSKKCSKTPPPLTNRPVGRLHDRISSSFLIRHLSISDDDQNVVSSVLLNRSNGLFDHRREVGGSRQIQRRCDLVVAPQDLLKSLAATPLREREAAIALGSQIAKPKGWDDVVVVESFQHATDHGNDTLQPAKKQKSVS